MPSDARERLDQYLVRLGWARSRRAAHEMLARGMVRVNGRVLRKGEMVGGGDTVEIGETSPLSALAPDIDVKVEILFRDPAMLVVNKPAPMACHPLRPGERGTVMNGVVAAFPEVAAVGDNPREGGLVHRLDNGTSGALLVALSHRLSGHCATRFERAGFAETTRPWSLAILKNHFILKSRSRTIRATRDEC